MREAVLTDGFSALFGADLWPVTTAAMQALEVRIAGVFGSNIYMYTFFCCCVPGVLGGGGGDKHYQK